MTPVNELCNTVIGDWLYPQNPSDDPSVHLHQELMWSVIICGASGLLAILISVPLCLIAACDPKRYRIILASACLAILGSILLVTTMGLWHAAGYVRTRMIPIFGFELKWPDVAKQATSISYSWSYMIAWAGIGALGASSAFLMITYCFARSEGDTIYAAISAQYCQNLKISAKFFNF